MNQDQQVDTNLQKAIDDITNNTNQDPVFADPVAAPSSVPEGDTGELAEPIGPFPTPKVEVVQAAEQIAPIDPINIPDLPLPPAEAVPAPEPFPAPAPTIDTSLPTPPVSEPQIVMSKPSPEPINIPTSLNMHQIKEAALRDLIPLLDHLDMAPSQKFSIYRDIFEDLKDYTVLEPAYHAATEISDEHERAEALLYLVESIDKM